MDASMDELLKRRVARFVDRRADWDAFADARVEGFRRAQHRFIGAGVSDPDDMSILCAIETRSGVRGTLVDAFGVYSDPLVGAFLHDVVVKP